MNSDKTDLWRLNGQELASGLRQKHFTACAVTRSVLDRLEKVNPKINAVIQEMPEEALAQAAAIDKTLAAGQDPGPLAGIPVSLKVNIDQAGHATTNGLAIQKDLIAQQDNPVVANLRKAGAVFIGRTNTPAFSTRWFTRNGVHGWTRNPHDASLTPGGSSGGAAAALAAGIGAIAHGSDIAGSVRYPAYACGVHGLRPSFGRVPQINFTAPDRYIGGQLMSVSGPLARTIADVELAYDAMRQADPRDVWQVPPLADPPPVAKRAALAIAPDGLPVHPDVEASLRDAAETLRQAGWEVVERALPPLRKAMEAQLVLWVADFERGTMPAMEREGDADALFVQAQLVRHAGPVGFSELMDALQTRLTLIREWHLFMADFPLILTPVSAEPPFPDQLDVQSEAAYDRVLEAQMIQIATPLLGTPALTVSTGFRSGKPCGVQLMAQRFREDVLFTAGKVLEADCLPVDP